MSPLGHIIGLLANSYFTSRRSRSSNQSAMPRSVRSDLRSTKTGFTGAVEERFDDGSRPLAAEAYRYDAFISYAHGDNAVARKLHQGLERIGRPRGAAKAARIFRDTTDLTANPDLWDTIKQALDSSRFLVVVLSPEAASSLWVLREYDEWRSKRGTSSLLLACAAGTLNFDPSDARSCFTDDSTAALPAMKTPGAFPHEPLFIDLRQLSAVKPTSPLMREQMVAIAAPIHGVDKRDLFDAEVTAFRRRRAFLSVLVALLVVLTATAATLAVLANRQRIAAEQREDEAVALALAAQSRTVLTDDPGLAVALAAEATQATDEPLWQAQSALVDARLALSARPKAPLVKREGTGDVKAVAVLDSNRVVYLADNDLHIRDVFAESQSRVLHTAVTAFDLSAATGLMAVVSSTRLSLWSTDTLTAQKQVYDAQIRPQSVMLSRGAKTASMVDASGNFEIVDLATMSLVAEGAVEVGRTRAEAVSPAGDTLAVGGSTGRVTLMTTATGTPRGTIRVPSSATALTYLSDETLLIGTKDGRVYRHEPTGTFEMPKLATPSGPVSAFALSPDETVLAIGGSYIEDGLSLYGTSSWDRTATLPHYGPRTLAFSPDGRYVFAGSFDEINVWASGASVGSVAQRYVGTARQGLDELAAAAGKDWFVTAGTEQGIQRWPTNALAAQPTTIVDRAESHPIDDVGSYSGVQVSRDGTSILRWSASWFRVWETTTERLVADHRPPDGSGGIDGATFFGDDKIATFGGGELNIVNIDDQGSQAVNSLEDIESLGYIDAIAISPDGRQFAADGDNEVAVWEVASGERTTTIDLGDETASEDLEFNSDGTMLGTAGTTASIWSTETGELLLRRDQPGDERYPTAIAFDPSDKRVGISYEGIGGFEILDIESGQLLGKPIEKWDRWKEYGTSGAGFAFTVDGEIVLADGNGAPLVWDRLWDGDVGCQVARTRALRKSVTASLPASRDPVCDYDH